MLFLDKFEAFGFLDVLGLSTCTLSLVYFALFLRNLAVIGLCTFDETFVLVYHLVIFGNLTVALKKGANNLIAELFG